MGSVDPFEDKFPTRGPQTIKLNLNQLEILSNRNCERRTFSKHKFLKCKTIGSPIYPGRKIQIFTFLEKFSNLLFFLTLSTFFFCFNYVVAQKHIFLQISIYLTIFSQIFLTWFSACISCLLPNVLFNSQYKIRSYFFSTCTYK